MSASECSLFCKITITKLLVVAYLNLKFFKFKLRENKHLVQVQVKDPLVLALAVQSPATCLLCTTTRQCLLLLLPAHRDVAVSPVAAAACGAVRRGAQGSA
jgi:hypothetical protein